MSIHSPYESAQYQKLWNGWGYTNPYTPMRESSAQDMRLHYWAATSFMDFAVGELLNNLDRTGQTNSTIVCFTSDHGWST